MIPSRKPHFIIWIVFIAILSDAGPSQAAERRPRGVDIYRKLCVKCHGPKGEGIKGKYDEPLQGDWSVQKLARVIDKTMPEDNPKKCVGQDAEAVAQYIHETFYSKEARARAHPPRVELVHLTNRQFLNSAADLLKRFTSDEIVIGEDHGLQATYYNSRNFNAGKKVCAGIDSRVNFDFTVHGFDEEPLGTNEISVQWRGSVVASETGNYDFLVKTSNGFRLWVNNETDPLVDGWVASGQMDEHRGSIRLLAGRAYPLRLDFFRFKEKAAGISLQWKPPHGTEQIIPSQNLSPVKVPPTFVVSTPFPPDDSSMGYERGLAVSKAWDEATTHAAIEIANYIVKRLDQLSNSKPSDDDRAAKVGAFCTNFVSAAFRRPLTGEQKRAFVTIHFKETTKLEDAVKRIVLLSLKSPRFLYLGLDTKNADDFEVASRLSFAIWDSIPDSKLIKLAEEKSLHTPEQVRQAALRMLCDQRARGKMLQFLQEWVQINHVEDLTKDPQIYPDFTPAIIGDLRTSLNLFLEDVFWSDKSDYRKLMLADYLYFNDRLGRFYGINTNLSHAFEKVTFNAQERSGVITHPYLLSEFAYAKSSSPIHRGVFLTRNIVGRALKPPPMAVVFKDSEFDPKLSMREKVVQLTKPQSCQGCHSVINPLGFSLENYDGVGKFRTAEKGRPIDAVSEYMTDDGETVKLKGARDVAEFAIKSEQAQDAFIEQLFHQLVKQPMLAYGVSVKKQLRDSFLASEFSMQNLVIEIATRTALYNVEKPKDSKKKI